MLEHLNEQQLRGYRDRTLALGELVAVDTHLGSCERCRSALASIADGTSSASVVSGIDQARFRHLSYEQIDDWVEDRLDAPGRELVMAHIGVCSACARQLIAYQEYAPAMAAPIRTAAAVSAEPLHERQSFWSFLKQPQYALGAAALISFFIVTPLTRHSSPEPAGAILAPTSIAVDSAISEKSSSLIDEAVSASELDSLPDSLRAGAKGMVASPESVARPATLKGLEPNGDTTLEYPCAEVVAEPLPVMRWKNFGVSYDISIYDSRHSLIARQGNLKETRWMPPSPLVRDRIYTWEVESAGHKHQGSFRVLGDARLRESQRIRAEHGNSHLVMGAVSEQLGLLTDARQEFETMAKDPAQAQQAGKLLCHIDALRK